MFMKAFGLGAPVLLGSLYMTGNLGTVTGKAYDQPPAQVYAALAYMPMPADLKKDILKGRSTVTVDRVPDTQVRWRFARGGRETFSVTADISPLSDGRGASVATSVEAKEIDAEKDMDIMPGMGGVFVEEQIAATLEHRPYDQKAAQKRAAVYMMGNQKEMFKNVSKSMEATAKRMDAAESGASRGGASFQAGKPMIDVRRDFPDPGQ